MSIKHLLALAATAAAIVPHLEAVQTHFIEQQGFKAFSKGELENLSLSQTGELRVAPGLRELAVLDDSVIWSVVPDADGNLILGTGNDGRVLKLDRDNNVSVLFEPDSILSRALAVDSEGNIFVGTSPDGAIYRLPAAGGKPELFHDPSAAYIWDFALRDDALFVALGSPAELIRIPLDDPNAKAESWLRTEDDHLTVLFEEGDGSLLVGSSGRGIVYRVTGPDKAEAILAAEEPEIRAIATDAAGRPVIAAYSASGSPRTQEPEDNDGGDPNELPPFVVTASADEAGPSGGVSKPGGARERGPGSGRLYLVKEGGVVLPMWRSRDHGIFALAPLGKESWLLGLNADGRTLVLEDRYQWHWVQNTPRGGAVSHILQDPLDPAGFLIFTSNPGAVYRLGGVSDAPSVFTSEVVDARQVGDWGELEVITEGQFPVRAAVRVGNTPSPDALWSDWQDVELADNGGALRGPIAGAPSRYMQYRLSIPAEVKGRAVIHRVRGYYRVANAEPSIVRFEVLPFGAEWTETPTPANPMLEYKQAFSRKSLEQFLSGGMSRYQLQRMSEDGQFTVVWYAVDPNGDPMTFSVYLRKADGGDWIRVFKDLKEPIARINTRGLGDGFYRVRVDASDDEANPNGDGRTASRVSDLIVVDNSPPSLQTAEDTTAPAGSTILRASDTMSRIYSAFISSDGGEFTRLIPQDGLFDSANETFAISAESGVSTIVEVYDEAGNAAVWVGE